MPPFFYAAKSTSLQSILYNVSNSTMSSNTAQNVIALERNFSNVTALCSWILVMLKWHLEQHLQFEMSTHNVITVSAEKEEEWQKKNQEKRENIPFWSATGASQTISWDSFSLNWLRCKGLAAFNKRQPWEIIIGSWCQTGRSGGVVFLL